ncbi:MAG TPA: hypothetical protein VFY29_11285 [Terriglobia bacterium]|nr:hypothetical protein [Terriglobia bacterium]
MKTRVSVFLMVVFLTASSGWAQQASPPVKESNRGRTVLTAVGAGGGFVAGVFLGLKWFDSSINADRKVWGSAIAGAGLGAVGGYLAGRSLDRRSFNRASVSLPMAGREVSITPVMTGSGAGAQFALRF